MPQTRWLCVGDAWEFIETLGATDAWIGAATSARNTPGSKAARDVLEALVRQEGLAVMAWYLNDGVDTVAWYWNQVPRKQGNRGRETHTAIEAARAAALAVLLRRRLGERRFRILYEPFESVVPQGGSAG
jgi:hypothetical protein